MNTSAPRARLVDALSGQKAPDKFMAALSEADSLCAELDTLRELQTRVQELAAENTELRQQLGQRNETIEALTRARSQAMVDADYEARKAALVAAERDDLAERLHDLAESHQITLSRLAVADAQLKRMQATR